MFNSATHVGDVQTERDENLILRTLNAFAVDLIAIPNVDDLFWYVAQNVVGQLKFVDCVIYRADDDQTKLVQVAALGEKNPFGRSIVNPLDIPFGQGITGQVAQTREAVVVDELSTDQNYIQDTQRARSEICVPIICGNTVVGVIDSEHPEPHAFGAPELEVLITIAAMTSAKLELLAEAERSNQRYHDLVAAHAQLSLEATNRKALEEALSVARKREAVGQLTGRFAHEFNNLLTVISGNLELLEGTVQGADAVQTLRDAQGAAHKGADLIQSMLSYSRRSHLQPKRVNLNEVVSRHLINHDVAGTPPTALTLAHDLNTANVDCVVLDTVLVNLISNARDAMSGRGEVHIRTRNITHRLTDNRPLATPLLPGAYVCLSVEDTGDGMTPQAVQQIFDPFYTTKPVGSGTGLGLSMTLGFMQQSGGTVAVHSDVGKGSTFQLYFPTVSPE